MAEIARIQNESKENLQNINREHNLAMLKHWGGFGLELGSAFVPGVGGAKLAGMAAKQIAPKVGRKIAKEIADATLKGISQGAVEGFGRGLAIDENPLKTAAQDSVLGTVLGAGGGVVGGILEKNIRKNKLKNLHNLFEDKKLSKYEKKNYIQKSKKYYKDYEQGVETIVDGLGSIKLTSDGLNETISQNPKRMVEVVDLSKNIKNSKLLDVETPKHSHRFPITKFYHLKGDNVDYQIAENKKGNKYFYKITDPYLTGPEPEGGGLPSTQSASSIIQPSVSQCNLNPFKNLNHLSFDEWLKELKRKRRRGF